MLTSHATQICHQTFHHDGIYSSRSSVLIQLNFSLDPFCSGERPLYVVGVYAVTVLQRPLQTTYTFTLIHAYASKSANVWLSILSTYVRTTTKRPRMDSPSTWADLQNIWREAEHVSTFSTCPMLDVFRHIFHCRWTNVVRGNWRRHSNWCTTAASSSQ